MRSRLCVLTWLPIILASCSPYKEVSLSNFKEFEVTDNVRGSIQYVLKKHSLQYSATDSRNNINYYNADQSRPSKSQSFLIEENIVVPKGAIGVCVNSCDDKFIIDFGKGVLVPFDLFIDDHRAIGKIVVDGRAFSIEINKRNPHLRKIIFDCRRVDNEKDNLLSLLPHFSVHM